MKKNVGKYKLTQRNHPSRRDLYGANRHNRDKAKKNNLTFERKLSPAITPAVGFVEVMPPTARAPLCVKNCTDR